MATIIKSKSLGFIPARSKAICEALKAKPEAPTPFLAILLSLIPVRAVIHSSEVSTIFSKSELSRRLDGKYLPNPAILADFINSPINCRS